MHLQAGQGPWASKRGAALQVGTVVTLALLAPIAPAESKALGPPPVGSEAL